MIGEVISQVSVERLRWDLFRLCRDPLPFRKVNYTVPGHALCSLDEADGLIAAELAAAGLAVVRTPYRVQAFRCDETKPLHHWYSKPAPEDPWYTACNLEATLPGHEKPEEIIQLVSHKDSMSWIDSPGAHDNGTGTVVNLELARILAGLKLRRTVRVLFCNEEHTPWTSRFAAAEAARRGDRIVAVLNQDSIAGKPDEARAAGRLTHAAAYSTPEGREIAELEDRLNRELNLGLDLNVWFKEYVNDDDGMFIKEGFARTVMNVGSCPYKDSQYHLVGDVPERVDLENVRRSAQLVLAAILALDAE
ncbi:MAG: M28 family peptidase [Lentisphaeria bacterium]|jgi:hypothetical protein|nr:M28 family peptidase [Lentisphaeria bacterium]